MNNSDHSLPRFDVVWQNFFVFIYFNFSSLVSAHFELFFRFWQIEKTPVEVDWDVTSAIKLCATHHSAPSCLAITRDSSLFMSMLHGWLCSFCFSFFTLVNFTPTYTWVALFFHPNCEGGRRKSLLSRFTPWLNSFSKKSSRCLHMNRVHAYWYQHFSLYFGIVRVNWIYAAVQHLHAIYRAQSKPGRKA